MERGFSIEPETTNEHQWTRIVKSGEALSPLERSVPRFVFVRVHLWFS